MITYYLEMKSKDDLAVKTRPLGIDVIGVEIKNFRFNKFLYQLIGENWSWSEKLSQTDNEWRSYAEAANLRTWVAYVRGSIAGYYELQSQRDGSAELAYFGLAPDFIGKGYGGYLLSHAIQSAWALPGIVRVWVHTCTLDHPSALNNYQARGFIVYDEVHS